MSTVYRVRVVKFLWGDARNAGAAPCITTQIIFNYRSVLRRRGLAAIHASAHVYDAIFVPCAQTDCAASCSYTGKNYFSKNFGATCSNTGNDKKTPGAVAPAILFCHLLGHVSTARAIMKKNAKCDHTGNNNNLWFRAECSDTGKYAMKII